MSHGPSAEAQVSEAVLMVRPAHFGSNEQTARSNFFQRRVAADAEVALQAQREFDALALALSDAGVRVHAFAGQHDRALPDEVFPNNWLSLHADGTAVLYPLLAENRRGERRPEILTALVESYGYRIDRIVDLTGLEERGEYLEGTGSLVLDRTARLAFACRSPRTTPSALAEFSRRLGYEVVPFAAVDAAGRAIYHTNVMLALGARFAAVCPSTIVDPTERNKVTTRLEASGHEVVELSRVELEAFAGNLLELAGSRGAVIALSAAAAKSLSARSRRALERYGAIVTADVATIERIGGGSVRCMLAEVALPRERQSPDG